MEGMEVSALHYAKFVGGKGVIINSNTNQSISKEFWRGYFSGKSVRFQQLKLLELNNFSQISLTNLALVMHDLSIRPKKIEIDGIDAQVMKRSHRQWRDKSSHHPASMHGKSSLMVPF